MLGKHQREKPNDASAAVMSLVFTSVCAARASDGAESSSNEPFWCPARTQQQPLEVIMGEQAGPHFSI